MYCLCELDKVGSIDAEVVNEVSAQWAIGVTPVSDRGCHNLKDNSGCLRAMVVMVVTLKAMVVIWGPWCLSEGHDGHLRTMVIIWGPWWSSEDHGGHLRAMVVIWGPRWSSEGHGDHLRAMVVIWGPYWCSYLKHWYHYRDSITISF